MPNMLKYLMFVAGEKHNNKKTRFDELKIPVKKEGVLVIKVIIPYLIAIIFIQKVWKILVVFLNF